MTNEQRQNIIEDFIQYCKDRLDINQLPIIQFTNDREWATERKSFGQYNPNDRSLEIYTGNRNLADTLRTLVHELVHHKQNEDGLIRMDSGKTGSKIENQANAFAGIIMREYGNKNDLIYEALLPTLKQIYEVENSRRIQIYCDMDGVLCDFDKKFDHYYGIPPREYYTTKGSKAFEDAVNKAGIEFWSKMDWMTGGRELWSIIGKYDPIILTSPSKFKYAKEGKIEWINNNLNPQPKKILFGQTGDKHSQMITDPKNSMLIDDYWPNLAPWKELGGIAIMHKDINKTKSILDKFGISKQISYTKPNFSFEWEEAERYPEFKKLGKKDWIELANTGYNIKYSKIKDYLGNVDLDFENLEEPKKQRFNKAFEKSEIEMPIVVKFNDKDYDLVAGNTRLSGLINKGIDPIVWVIKL